MTNAIRLEHRLKHPMEGRTAYEGMGSGWPGLLNRIDGILASHPDGRQ
ncbi:MULTISPECIES: hypothetical protein [Micrococcaceae]|jgi:hypothetical protein|nr:hypothetical protein [Arthrobacter sp. Leaf137]MDQ1054614.1 hypothetical protein [Arthrobacter sp. SORGH_AS_0212]